ncbi:hypothetical protein [Paenibacillus sp. HB172176]|uniref:hypothetical protein n=1 Tax=Paenibacillus sp. HB172176 TaxID=2493690 RepID=UPI00143A4D0D|nr:hypothetical protein [Paenibacillus sp. HB172176]
MDHGIFGIDQSVLKVPRTIENSLRRLRRFGYRIDSASRFEIYKTKFNKLYLESIMNQKYMLEDNVQEELLYGYKDYWELIRISESKTILTSMDKSVRNEINNIFNGSILECKDSKPWNFQFQYNLSSIFEHSGFKVDLKEPDFVFRYKGKTYSVAAKRLISKKGIQANLEKAEEQISKTENYGFIAISLDKIFRDSNRIITLSDPDKSVREANEIIQNILAKDFVTGHFGRRSSQILGIIAYISFPYYSTSDKPLFELGYTSYIMFLPINEPDSPEWNEAVEISDQLHKLEINNNAGF